MENKSRLQDYEKFGRSIIWTLPERVEYADAAECQRIFDSIDKFGIKMMVFDFLYTEHVHSSMIGFLIIMRKKLLAMEIEPVFMFSEYMEKITKMLWCYDWFIGEKDEWWACYSCIMYNRLYYGCNNWYVHRTINLKYWFLKHKPKKWYHWICLLCISVIGTICTLIAFIATDKKFRNDIYKILKSIFKKTWRKKWKYIIKTNGLKLIYMISG